MQTCRPERAEALKYPLLTVNSVNSKNNKNMAKEEMKYEQAVRELEQIVERMENDELDIDQLSEQLKRAKTLVKLCKDKLTKTDEEIKKLLSED
jgi:exodeoxyribonuclease VII small subunit